MSIISTAFFTTLILTRSWIKIARRLGLVGVDMNKYSKPKVPEGGGVSFIIGTMFAMLVYVFLKTFFLHNTTNLTEILIVIITLLLAGFLGFIDDMLGWKKGLKKWQKPLLTIPIAIPLMVINAGSLSLNIPFLGVVNFGVLFPLLIIPLGVIGATNGFNMLAGFNGLETLMGITILSTLGFVAFTNNLLWLTTIIFSAVFSLLGFLVFNKYPAKVFPGNTLTHVTGALIACVAILGNMEKIAMFLFIPYFIELLIKAKNKFRTECFGEPQKDGTLKPPAKTGSLAHLILRFTRTERGLVFSLFIIELMIAATGLIFLKG